MEFAMSEENSKRVLSGTKWIANAGQNYFASLNNSTKPTSSGKKLINAFLLVPIIVPTAITAFSFSFAMLFLNAVNAQKDDSKLSKVIKFIVRSLIYIAAAVILIPCIILNLVISPIPGLIFYYINKDVFNQKNTNIEGNQGQTVNTVEVNSDQEYNKLIKEKVNGLTQQNDEEQGQSDTDLYQSLIRSGQLHNQPTVEVISRVVQGEQDVDKIIVAKHINNNGVQNGEIMMRKIGDDHNFIIGGIMTGNAPDRQESFAAGFGFQCKLPEDKKGVDFHLDFSMRTGETKQEATQALMQSGPARTILSSDNGGILPIEQPGSSKTKTVITSPAVK